MTVPAMTSQQVLTALRSGPLREPAHAWLLEVRNSVGYTRQVRYADALVLSVWPSRGLWIAGIEVKISRNDWLRELDNPKKSAELQRFCHYWWIAAPEGVVNADELPEKWGHYVIRGQKARASQKATLLKPDALTMDFVASVLRNQSECTAAIRDRKSTRLNSSH